MAKGLLDILLDSIFDAEWKGRRGEKLTERELKFVKLLGRKGKILKNVYIPKGDNETTEIDVLFITQKGIIVIESKNYSGWIFGDEKAAYWTAMLPNKQKNKFYNPVKQNAGHIKWLSNYLEQEIPLFSLIVFSERCELKKISIETPEIQVIKRDRLYATVRQIWDNSQDHLDEEQCQAVYEKLEKLTHVDAALKEAHVEMIEKKYKNESKQKTLKDTKELKAEEEPDERKAEEITGEKTKCVFENTDVQPENVSERVCPRCGNVLVKRIAKKGPNAGNSFWGCSNFPKCRYTETEAEISEK